MKKQFLTVDNCLKGDNSVLFNSFLFISSYYYFSRYSFNYKHKNINSKSYNYDFKIDRDHFPNFVISLENFQLSIRSQFNELEIPVKFYETSLSLHDFNFDENYHNDLTLIFIDKVNILLNRIYTFESNETFRSTLYYLCKNVNSVEYK